MLSKMKTLSCFVSLRRNKNLKKGTEMNSEKLKLAKAVINSDIQQFQTTMKDMIDQRIVEKIRQRRNDVFERCGFKRLEQDK